MKAHIKHHSITVIAVLVVLAVGAGIFVYSGLYNIGADDHHTKPVFKVMQTLRDRSIHLRSKDLTVPNLEDPQLILKGAGQYAAMCTGCHLKPGMQESEIRPGLYPQPPNLSKVHVNPKDAFWVIKHGIKMSAMPAWGSTHDDPTIWSMVAFLQKLPAMSADQYNDIVSRAPADEDMEQGGGHHHGPVGGESAEQGMQHSSAGDKDSHDDDAHEHDGDTHHDAAAEQGQAMPAMTAGAVPQAEATAKALHAALQSGGRDAVLDLLAPGVRITEGGHTQTRDEYAAGHLGDDIAFLQSARVTLGAMRSGMQGDLAMVQSDSNIKANSKGKAINIDSHETLTLQRQGDKWTITAIEWRSGPES